MIVKIKSHKRPVFAKVLNYMLNNTDRLFDKEGKSFAITHNLKGNSIEAWEKQYKHNETYRLRKRKDSVLLTHEILSWHRDDAKHITLSKMESMAREYLHLRNSKGLYVAVPHFDKDHYHIHILASGIEYKTGKSLRFSKADFHKLKKDIQQYQLERFPELSKSIVAHGKKNHTRLSDKEYQVKLRTGRETEKVKVIRLLESCFKKANSMEMFYKLLKDSEVQIYERRGKMTGVILKEYKFRFSRLGYSEEKIVGINKFLNREQQLSTTREKKEKNITRNI
jgi:hypothetical protein